MLRNKLVAIFNNLAKTTSSVCRKNDEFLSVKSSGIYMCINLYAMCLPQEKAVDLQSDGKDP